MPQWPQRPGSNRAGSSTSVRPPDRFDALLDETSGDARPAAPEYDRSRTPDRRDDTRAADDRAAARARGQDARAQDARAADRQQAAEDRSAARAADDAKAQQDSDKAAAAKDRPAADASDATQPKAKPAATPAEATQAQDKPAAKASDATQAATSETPAQSADPATAEAQAKAATSAAAATAAVLDDTAATVKTSDNTTEPDKDSAAAATTMSDPNAVAAQVAAIAIPVNPLPTIDPSAGTASATAADAGAKPETTAQAAAAQAAAARAAAPTATEQATASTSGTDSKTANTAPQESFKALAEAAGAKTPAGADAKAEHAGKAKSAEHGKTASINPAEPAATDAAQPAGLDGQVSKTGAATTNQGRIQTAEHATPSGRRAAGEVRAEAVTATAGAQAGSNAPILPLNLAQPIALPLSTMFQVAVPKADAAMDTAVPVAGLAVEIVSRAQEGGKRFDIRLDPPELGRVDVRLNVDDNGKVTSHLVVERAETLDLLRRDAPQLERTLQQAGLNTEGGMQFSLRDQNLASRDQFAREANTSHLIVPEDDTAAADAARRGYGRLIGLGGGIDIRV